MMLIPFFYIKDLLVVNNERFNENKIVDFLCFLNGHKVFCGLNGREHSEHSGYIVIPPSLNDVHGLLVFVVHGKRITLTQEYLKVLFIFYLR